MLVYTSVTRSYLPKARVLAESVKRLHPEWSFAVLLSDVLPDEWDPAAWPFDHVVLLPELGIPDWKSWAFGHTVVELCTAVKGRGALVLIDRVRPDKIMYLDPDIQVYASLQPLSDLLDSHDILLTPHLLDPETTPGAIVDNELCTLRHGTYNLGFYAATTAGQGLAFIEWWADRLSTHCISDIPGGVFTDQRWCDLAPCYFDTLHIVRDRGCNVATWNVAHRRISRTPAGDWMAGDVPLRFYHFTGYDSGDGIGMLERYASDQPAAFRLWDDYRTSLLEAGQGQDRFKAWEYSHFSNGAPITAGMRRLYRARRDLQEAFPDPYRVEGLHCYYEWWQAEVRAGRIDATNQPSDSAQHVHGPLVRSSVALFRSTLGRMRRASSPSELRANALRLAAPCISLVIAVAVVLLAIYGVARHFTTVPSWDMWDGGVRFFLNSGDPAAWWKPHNEHRIVLAKALFWLDYRLWGGTGAPLVALNYAMLGVFALTWLALLRSSPGLHPLRRAFFGAALVAWSFQWMQCGNLILPFQVQFFLAYLVPLLSFLAIGASADRRSDALFLASVIGGVLSLGTMANGVLVLPMLAVMAALLGYSRMRVVCLTALSCCAWALYFWKIKAGGAITGTPAVIRTLDQAWSLAGYVFLFLGSPIYHLAGGGSVGTALGIAAGVVACAITIWLARPLLTSRNAARGIDTAIVAFAVYVIASAAATAYGRHDRFGLEQAATFRYTTPAVMLWAALLCGSLRSHHAAALRQGRMAIVLVLAVECIVLNRQWDAVRWPNGNAFESRVGGLALGLGAHDDEAIAPLHPRPEQLNDVATAARQAGVSIFRYPPFNVLAEIDGNMITRTDVLPCKGNIDRIEERQSDDRFTRIDGWVIPPCSEHPAWGRIVDSDGRVVGAVVCGRVRTDVEAVYGEKGRHAGFSGYMLAGTRPFSVILMGQAPLGRLDVPHVGATAAEHGPATDTSSP